MSAVIAPKGPKQDKRDKYFALLGIPKLTPAQTAKAQKLARKIVKADEAQAKADAQAQAKIETARLLYDARHAKCEQAQKDLEVLQPVTAAAVKAFADAISAAEALAKNGDYAKATEQLAKVSATHAPEKASKAWDEAVSSAQKLAPKAFEAAKRIDAMLADPQARLSRAAIMAARRSKFDQIRLLLAPKQPKATLDGATQAIQDLEDKLKKDVEAAKADWTRTEMMRAEISRKLNAIAPLSGDEVPLLTDRESAPMRLQLASALTSMNLCEFDGARAVLQPLRDEVDDIATRMGPMRDEWKQHAARLPPLAADSRKFADEAQCPKVKEDASALASELQQLLAQGPGKAFTLTEALDLADDAPSQLDTLRGQEQSYMLFQRKASGPMPPGADGKPQKALEESRKNIDRLFKDVHEALEKLRDGVSTATKGAHERVADAPFTQRRDALREEWAKRVAQARDPASLDEAGMHAQLFALRRDIDKTWLDVNRLQAAIDDGRLGRAADEYRDARGIALSACDELLSRDAIAGADTRLAIDQICAPVVALAGTGAPATLIAAYRDATASLKSKTKRIGTKTLKLEQDVKAMQAVLVQRLEAMGQRVLEVKAMADSAKNASKQAPLVALFETLQASLDGLRAMSRLSQLDGLERTETEADAFENELAQSIAAAKGDSSDDAMSFDKARKAIANLKEKLGEKKYRLYCIETQDKISTQLKELEEQLGKTTMGELTKRIGDLQVKVNDMKLSCDLAEKATETFEKDTVKPLLKRLDDKAFNDAPEFRASLKSQIEALVGEFRYEGGQTAATGNAKKLGDHLTAVLQGAKDARGVPQALAAEQSAALKAKNDAIVDEGKWKGESEVLEKGLKALKPQNPREVEPLLDMLESARSTAKKSGNYAAGRDQLVAIRKRMSLIAANPRGLAITARNKLPQVNARVKRAVAGYQEALGAIDKAVQGLSPTDLDVAGRQAVADQLAALRGLFNPGAFEEAVATMSAKGGSREQRSAGREKGLREVRRMQAYLNSDGRLRTLSESPWFEKMPSVLSELNLALLDIENNMLVSI